VAGQSAEAAVDGLAFEASGGALDFGDDIAAGKLGGAGALVKSLDGVEDGFSAARPGMAVTIARRATTAQSCAP
jgi:hypothetical protein